MSSTTLLQSITFTTLGMTVLEEVHTATGEVYEEILGGEGMYSVVGARMFNTGFTTRSIGYVLRGGMDFPPSAKAVIEGWDTHLICEIEPQMNTTRARIVHRDEGEGHGRLLEYNYLNPLLELSTLHVKLSPFLSSKSFYLCCSPEEIASWCDGIEKAPEERRPLIIWEPRPDASHQGNLDLSLRMARMVDIYSPTLEDFTAMWNFEPGNTEALCNAAASFAPPGNGMVLDTVGVPNTGAVIIQTNDGGCIVRMPCKAAIRIPPYYSPLGGEKRDEVIKKNVVNVIGARSAFLGAFAVGFLRSKREAEAEQDPIVQAAYYGIVAASFVQEQYGPPMCSKSSNGMEIWNHVSVEERLSQYKSRKQPDEVLEEVTNEVLEEFSEDGLE